MAEKEIRLQRLRRHPLRYAIPNAITAVRPVLAHYGMEQIKGGHKARGLGLLSLAWLTDAEGFIARWLNATSKAGYVADPVADRLMLLEMLRGMEMDKTAKTITYAAEGLMAIGALTLLGYSKFTGQETSEPHASLIGKARFSIHAGGAARLIFKPNDTLSSWGMAGASVAAALDYGISAIKSLRYNKNTHGAD